MRQGASLFRDTALGERVTTPTDPGGTGYSTDGPWGNWLLLRRTLGERFTPPTAPAVESWRTADSRLAGVPWPGLNNNRHMFCEGPIKN